MGFLLGRLQTLRECRLPRSVSDRRHRANGVRRRVHPAGRLQRLRLLRRDLPVRRGRSASRGWAGVQVHVLLRPAEGGASASLRDRVPDAVDPVRGARHAARSSERAGPRTAGEGHRGCRRLRPEGNERGGDPRDLRLSRAARRVQSSLYAAGADRQSATGLAFGGPRVGADGGRRDARIPYRIWSR